MKKNLFLLGVAVAAFASCTSEEFVDMGQQKAIGFDTFVNNHTRAVTEVSTLSATDFYVFGKYGANTGTYDEGTVHNNELASNRYYWTAGKYYLFGAYADGAKGKIANATFDAANKKLTFANYTVDDKKDLVAAISADETRSASDLTGTTISPVSLTFKHLLSQVKFSFTTKDGEAYTIAISKIKVNAENKGTGVFATSGITWTPSNTKADYAFTDIQDVAVAVASQPVATDSKMVLPQAGTNNLKVTFTASITGPGITNAMTKDFTASLGISNTNEWKPGYRYNYTAEINGEVIAGLKPIEFTATVDTWQDAENQAAQPVPAK